MKVKFEDDGIDVSLWCTELDGGDEEEKAGELIAKLLEVVCNHYESTAVSVLLNMLYQARALATFGVGSRLIDRLIDVLEKDMENVDDYELVLKSKQTEAKQ